PQDRHDKERERPRERAEHQVEGLRQHEEHGPSIVHRAGGRPVAEGLFRTRRGPWYERAPPPRECCVERRTQPVPRQPMSLDPPPPGAPALANLDPGLPWRCPTCRRPAVVRAAEGEAELRCDAGHRFGCVDGVLCLCEGDNYAASFGLEWLHHSSTQVDK